MRKPGHSSCSTPSWQCISESRRTLIRSPALLMHEIHFVDTCSGRYWNAEDLGHAPIDMPASHRNLRDLIGPHDSLHLAASAYSLRLSPATDRVCQPGNQRNRHSRAAHREYCPPQVAPTDSKATEPSHCVRRTFSIQLLTCQLIANAPTVATKRQHDFSIQGPVIVQ